MYLQHLYTENSSMAASTERYRSPKRLKANMSEAVETYVQKDDEHNLNRGRMRVIKDPSLIPSGDSPGHFASLAISEPRGKALHRIGHLGSAVRPERVEPSNKPLRVYCIFLDRD